MASTKIYRTSGTPTLATAFTYSMWLKRQSISVSQKMIMSWQSSSVRGYIGFRVEDYLRFYDLTTTSQLNWTTKRLFRDDGAWYHIVVAGDSTESLAANRCKMYVNGTRIADADITKLNDQAQDEDWGIALASDTDKFTIGCNDTDGEDYSGSMSHFQFVDGLALAPTEFGEFDSTSGIWKLKTGCYATPGNSGFCLKMEDRSNLDLDSSSNALSFTTAGTLTATYDNPSNNFSTFNALCVPSSDLPTFSNGNNTTATPNASGKHFGGTSTLGMVGGKWYAEFSPVSVTNGCIIGVTGRPSYIVYENQSVGWEKDGFGYINDGNKKYDNSLITSYGDTYTDGDIIGVALDLVNDCIYFSKNGTWQNSGDPTSGASATGAAFSSPTFLGVQTLDNMEQMYAFMGSDNATGSTVINANFGNGYFGTTAVTSAEADGDDIGAFEYAPPTGYYALCTKNIKSQGGR